MVPVASRNRRHRVIETRPTTRWLFRTRDGLSEASVLEVSWFDARHAAAKLLGVVPDELVEIHGEET